MKEAMLDVLESPGLALADAPDTPEMRVRRMVVEHFDFVWRSMRALGLDGATAEDAAQHVFVIAAQKLADIGSGREKSFLFGTALGQELLRGRLRERPAGRARSRAIVMASAALLPISAVAIGAAAGAATGGGSSGAAAGTGSGGAIAPAGVAAKIVSAKWIAIGALALAATSTVISVRTAVVASRPVLASPVVSTVRSPVAESPRLADPPAIVTAPAPVGSASAGLVDRGQRIETPASAGLVDRGQRIETPAPMAPVDRGQRIETPTDPPLVDRDQRAPGAPWILPAPSLAGDVAELDAARALVRSDPRRALALLDDFDRQHPNSELSDEASVTRVEAYLAAGEPDRARAVAAAFVAARPTSPYVSRMRRLSGANP